MYRFDKDTTAGILRGLRATARMSRKEVAEKAGIGEASIKGYENGETVMSLEAAVKLANIYGVTPSDLVVIAEN